MSTKQLKIGVFGGGRGLDLAQNMLLNNCLVVAICDRIEARRKNFKKAIGDDTIREYADFDAFLQEDMDAVIIANDFHNHAPFLLKCFEKNLHVFCECIASATMAESVQLARAFKKSSSIFFLAENYPQMKFNREMQRVAKGGSLGKIIYAEGEYNHPVAQNDEEFIKRYIFHRKHWRNFLPATYYVTHSLGPIMRATGATPKRVTAVGVFCPPDRELPSAKFVADKAAIITTINDDDSVFKFTGCAGFGAHSNSYRLCGTKGQIENVRGTESMVSLRYNKWDMPEGKTRSNMYEPEWNDPDIALIRKSTHGGSDYITARMFVECVKQGVQPEHPFDLHSALAMSSVAILGHRSVLGGGQPYDIPDFHDEAACKQYENDTLLPIYGPNGEEPTMPCCSHPDYRPSEKQLELYDKLIAD